MDSPHKVERSGIAPSLRSQVEPFRAMDIVFEANRMKAAGNDVVMMCIGQPAAPAPSGALSAAGKALAAGRIAYTDSAGIDPLRRRIADHYGERYSINVPVERIVVTTGSSAAFLLAFTALFDEGARVGVPTPGYPAYRNILRALSLEAAGIATGPRTRWAVDAAIIDEAHREAALDGLVLANPNNPNGTMMTPPVFREVVEACLARSIAVISDEIYHGLTWEMEETTALSITDDAVVINSFSKYYCMPGWRIGWMVVPDALVDVIGRLQQNLFICAPEISQIAALAAMDCPGELEVIREEYRQNRAFMLNALRELGVGEIQPADGAFYLYADISPLASHSEELCRRMLREARVAVTPGTDFDPENGSSWARFSYAGSPGDMREGIRRLREFFGR